MSRAAISGLVCTTFLVFLGFSAVPQERERKGAEAESGQLEQISLDSNREDSQRFINERVCRH